MARNLLCSFCLIPHADHGEAMFEGWKELSHVVTRQTMTVFHTNSFLIVSKQTVDWQTFLLIWRPSGP